MLEDTVLIRHLSSSLTHQEKIELLQHFGAKDVKILGRESRKTNLVYARFENNKAAELAIQKLHQLDVLGQKISAEIARGETTDPDDPVQPRILNIHDDRQDLILKAKEAFLKKLDFSIRNYDFNQPPPLSIYYQYPPPTRLVLINICKAMANVPKFYNQVLHLMNKMNLPCPFTDTYPLDSDLFTEKKIEPSISPKQKAFEEEKTHESSSQEESEMGSDHEYCSGEIIPVKRKKALKRVMKRPKFLKPQIQTTNSGSKVGLKPDDVFENAQKEQVSKKIEMKITSNLSSIQEAQEIQATESTTEGFEVVKISQKIQEQPIQPKTKDESILEDSTLEFITTGQLAANRISVRDQRVLPVFKNYQAGAPSCRLYIKNLSKQVQTRDLHFIYRRYYQPELDQVQGSMFDIRLMQEGRMKGQAFITLQSIQQAQAALKETNGYILKDKPMVVQFARSATAK